MSADVEENVDEFVLMITFKMHEPPRRRRHSDDDSTVNESGLRGVSRDLLRSYAIGQRPNSAYNSRRRHSLGPEILNIIFGFVTVANPHGSP